MCCFPDLKGYRMRVEIRAAQQDEHAAVMQVARQSPYTRDFSNHIFSGETAYAKGWIRVAMHQERIVGFTCVRHKVREPSTSLYFIGVDSEFRDKGIGSQLLEDLMQQCPNPCIAVNVMNENEGALRFYARHGFNSQGEALKGKGVHLTKVWEGEKPASRFNSGRI